MIKRLADLVLSFTGLILLFPILLIVAFIIVLLEKKSPFFFQSRLGKQKRLFQIYKFRTMDAGEITRLGKVLLKIGIDELPQLLRKEW